MNTPITREEFVERFVAHMLKRGDKFDDGTPVEDYALQAAVSYWDEPHQRADGPEECAEADMSYWGED